LFGIILLFVLIPRVPAQTNVEIEYTLSIPDPLSHVYDVRMSIRGLRSTAVNVAMPAWTPGQYAILNYARNVQRFSASSNRGDSLQWEQTDKQTWRVQKQTSDDVHIAYQVYSLDLNDEMADLFPAAVFMYVSGQIENPVNVRFETPLRWRVYTGLEKRDDRFHADSYDALADAHAFIGEFKLLEFEGPDHTPHHVVFSNARIEATDQQITEDLKDLVEATVRKFGKLPYQDYTFLVKVANGQPASVLEHSNSARITVGSDDFVNQSGYRRFIGNAAHALVHVWNGKRVFPQAFAPLDYSKENYTRLLWFFEGATNYYSDLIQLRAGLTSDSEFLSRMSLIVDTLQHQAGRRLMSLEEASWNTWLRGDNIVNNGVSYVVKGEAVAMLLDLEIRARTKNRKSLDDVMQRLISDYAAKGVGVPEDGVLHAINATTEMSFDDLYDRAVRRSGDLDYNPALAYVGLRSSVFKQPASIYFGIETERTGDNQPRIRRVMPNSPAQRAALDGGDILVAMDSERITFDNLTSRIHSKRIGKPVVLTVLRGERLLTLNLTPAESQEEQWLVDEVLNATPEQVRNREAWLGMSGLTGR
jgi:predicted metalloprotease with PDZ domain